MSADLWQRGCERLAAELPEQQFNTWIRPLPPADVSDSDDSGAVVSLRVPNRFKLDWIRSQYAGAHRDVLSDLAGKPVRLELSLAPRERRASRCACRRCAAGAARAGCCAKRAAGRRRLHARPPMAASRTPRRAGVAAGCRGPPHRLNPALTFDTLVAGRANQMARTAALHVAGAPGVMYNPLFIYGGVGLGKTHLIHAVGNALLEDRPDARVLYLHAEQFISDVVKNYQRKTFDELKAKYHSLDLLLIDDVQFFAGKERTQEEFFNAFEALLAKRAHIIMTSDTYPKGLVDIDERLTARFDAGLTVAIEPPELEMRVAILIKKAGRRRRRDAGGRGLLRRQERARQRARARRRAAQGAGLHPLQPEGHQHRPGARGAEGPAVDPEPPDLGREHPEDGAPTSTRSRSPTCTARSARPPSRGRARSRCTWPRS